VLEKGTKVAGYEIEGILGHGGMGVVYEARQLSLGRTVALKILAGTLGMDPTFKDRFRHEGRIQAALDHPNIVTIFEAGEWEDSLFIAMRLVRGPNLKEMIIGRELEGARTLRILRPIAEALDSAHEAGLIHRDIKPQNILVGSRDRAYLADFGLTKGIDDAGLTQTGQFVGTIDYIAPEQIRGEQATAACDIYALSAVLYECLSGAVPYPKPSDAAVMYAHLSEPPPLVTDQRPELPPNLDEVICKGMDKDPVTRFQTATGLIDEAERALGKRVRAVITPPGPIEGPEEAGIREKEARVPTRPERVRRQPVPDPAPAGAAPTTPGTALAPAAAAAATAAAATAAGATAAGATTGAKTGPEATAPPEVAAPDDPTVAVPAVPPPGDPGVAGPGDATQAVPVVPAPGDPGVAGPADATQAVPVVPALGDPGVAGPGDATQAVPAVQPPGDPGVAAPGDATQAVPVVQPPPDPTVEHQAVPAPADPTIEARAVPAPADPTVETRAVTPPADPTVETRAVTPPADPTVETRAVTPPADPTVETRAAAPPAAPPLSTRSEESTADLPSPATAAMPAAERGRRGSRVSAPTGGAAVASPVPADDRERRTSSRAPWIAMVAALVIGGVVGYLLGKPADEPAPPRAADTGLSSSTTAGALNVRFPGSWERRGEAPTIPGLKLNDQVALGPGASDDQGVVVGMSDATGPLLLPTPFLASLGESLRKGDRVKLGDLEAIRYEGLEPKGFDGSLTVFAAPTSGGVATVACFAPRGGGQAFRPDCERVAGSLAVDGETALPVGADPAYGKDLGRVVTALNTRRKAGRDVLAKASTPRAQSQAAAALADTYALAGADLRGVASGPVTAPANDAIAKALQNAATAYKGLAKAGKPTAFRKATARVKKAEARVDARLAALKALGYDVG
jgi:hypothetical protein